MPLTPKGAKILANMKQEYGGKKGESVFYASANAGKISGVHHSNAENVQAFDERALGETPPRIGNPLAGHPERYTNPSATGTPGIVKATGTDNLRADPSTKAAGNVAAKIPTDVGVIGKFAPKGLDIFHDGGSPGALDRKGVTENDR